MVGTPKGTLVSRIQLGTQLSFHFSPPPSVRKGITNDLRKCLRSSPPGCSQTHYHHVHLVEHLNRQQPFWSQATETWLTRHRTSTSCHPNDAYLPLQGWEDLTTGPLQQGSYSTASPHNYLMAALCQFLIKWER